MNYKITVSYIRCQHFLNLILGQLFFCNNCIPDACSLKNKKNWVATCEVMRGKSYFYKPITKHGPNMEKPKLLEFINSISKNTLMETLGITYTDVGDDYLEATMEVSPKVHQPMGLLHGGASVALAESVGSAASHLLVDTKSFDIKGIEITANHLKSVASGLVTAKANLIHKREKLHICGKLKLSTLMGN